MKKSEIIFIGPYPTDNNGVSNYTSHYISEFKKMGYEVRSEYIYFLKSKLNQFNWLLLVFKLLGKKSVIILQHTPTISGPFVLIFLFCSKLFKSRILIVSHETPSTYAKYLPKFLKVVYHWYEKKIAQWSNAYIVHTNFHKNQLQNIGARKKINVVPHPIYNNSPAKSSVSRKYWGFYGQISIKKGLDLLLKVIQSFPPGYFPELKIWGRAAPGNENHVNSLMSDVSSEYNSAIQFLGYLPEGKKETLFSEVSLMIFPYRWVSQSGALSETCLHRIPYLASDIDFFKEFQNSFGCGRLFQTDSEASLKAELEKIKKTPLNIPEEDFSRMEKTLSIESCARRWESLF